MIHAAANGVVTVTNETTVTGGGVGRSGLGIDHRAPGSPAADPADLVFSRVSLTPGPGDPNEPLGLAAGSAAFCAAQGASVVCDNDQVDHVELDLGDGNDLVLMQPVERIGDHQTPGQADDPAIVARLGAGNDAFVGSPLAETVFDGPGSDDIQGYAPGGGGHDVIVQPDVADPATQDANDHIDTDYVAGMVDYGARTSAGVIVSARDWVENDGAPGENDRITAYGVRGTGFADTITAAVNGEEFIAYAFEGGGGDDVITGGAGADRLDGGDGGDELTGDIGSDQVHGGPGDDVLHENDAYPDNVVTCGAGADTVQADPPGVDADVEPAGGGGAGCESVTRGELPPLDTTVTSAPPSFTNDATPTVTFSASEPRASFECSLDGGPFVGCGSPLTPPAPLADGLHVLEVRSAWGVRKDPSPATVTTTVDTHAPDTSVTTPAAPVNGVLGKTWASDEPGAGFQCQVDAGAWVTCHDGLSVTGLTLGGHDLKVRAVDAAGNTDPTPASTTFTVPGPPSGDETPSDGETPSGGDTSGGGSTPTGGGAGSTPTGGGAGGGTTSPPPPADTTPPSPVSSAPKGQTPARVAGRGLALALTLDETATVKITLTVDAATARRLKLDRKAKKPVVIGTLTRSLGAGRSSVAVKLTAKARKALKKAPALKIAYAVQAKDAAGNVAKRSGSTTLKR